MVIKMSTASADVRQQRRAEARQRLRTYCMGNLKAYLSETTLHGLKFVADSSITIWERSFFLCVFLAGLITTAQLISNIYSKWNNTPVIIGTSPHPTSILKIPFPAITVCNMNQVLASKVANYSENSPENALLNYLCYQEDDLDDDLLQTPKYKNNNLKIDDFFINHAQPCSRMILSCKMSVDFFNCSDLFREIMTDEGLCCVFNTLHPELLYKGPFYIITELTKFDGRTAVLWNPETGYQENLPEKYYPRPASGTGASMGFSIVLNAEIAEYYCSSTNAPGFKVTMHNPIETPNIKETGLLVPVGQETRFRIDPLRSEAVPNIRSISKKSRQCLFLDEEKLLYYKYYTRRNCENECLAKFMYDTCQCIPYSLPQIYVNVSVCSLKDTSCIERAENSWMHSSAASCDARCLSSCFDLSFLPDAFSVPLAQQNYITQSNVLRNYTKEYAKQNLAIVHFYYVDYVFHGELKNVYIGFTEFLSNTGGIMGLFMGFSFISLAEVFYFAFLRPIFDYFLPLRNRARQERLLSLASELHRSERNVLLGQSPVVEGKNNQTNHYERNMHKLPEYN